MVTVMAMGKTTDEALKIKNEDVSKELGGLPENKLACLNIAAYAFYNEKKDYLEKV